ncbi:hypothetical protein HOD20_01315 [archaeon]|nr:hypothetical protein [archaeon]MBT4648274.1 hypothetical protein [archaeon]MBT6821526.1 hypothetical protein [archaeon]MBT7391925.1 hypothetical protein [archaeon]
MSWFGLGFVLYKISFMKIFFGKEQLYHTTYKSKIKNYIFDILIIISFYLLNFSDFTSILLSLNHKTHFFNEIIEIIINYSSMLELITFHLGGLIILFVSIYLGTKIKIEKNSLMSIIHEDFFPKTIEQKIIRSLSIFVILCGFYITYFNLISEWFTLVLGTPLTLVGLFSAIYILRNKHKIKSRNFKHKISKISEFFEKDMFNYFHEKSKIKYVFSGLLVLHIFTDLFSFLVPFLTNLNHNLYTFFLQKNRWIGEFIKTDLQTTNLFNIIWIYGGIIFFFIALTILPLLLWNASLRKKHISFHPYHFLIHNLDMSNMCDH